MVHDINSALEKLEKNLGELDSARSQVLKSVNASNDLLKMVTLYVTAVKNLADSLEQWESSLSARESELHGDFESAISSIRHRCTEIISAFNDDVSKATSEFKTETDKTLERFTEQNDKLAARVEELVSLREQIKKATSEIESVKGSLNEILKELKDSQDEQDKSLNDIQQKVTNLPSQVHEEALSLIQVVNNTEATLKDTVNTAISKADEIIVTARGISSNLDGINTLCQNINSSIISSTTNLTNVITGAKNDLENKLSEEVGKLDSNVGSIRSLCENIDSSIENFSGQVTSTLDTLKSNEQRHFDSVVKQLEDQEKRLNTEFDVVRKQNKIYSIVIIVLLIAIGCLIYFNGKI